MSDSVTSRPRSEKEIFFDALEKNTPQERAAFLDGACGTNPVQRAKVEALLADHFQQDSFMKEPAVDVSAPTLPTPPPSDAPAQMLGRYKLLEKIGEGGFGEVWMAEQREPVKRRVALKIIKLGMDSRQIVARFEAERQALAMMDHPNIAKIFDAGTTENPHPQPLSHPMGEGGRRPGEGAVGEGVLQSQIGNRKSEIAEGRPYFVMELVRGIKITEYCDQNQLPTQERLRLFILVCQAIQHAHQKGIIHRDIKPSNILVTLHDGVPVPKVIDFGIAKATQGELTDKTVFTQFQQFIGTPAYISPEQAEMSGLDIDTRSDIYSLGVLLYELLVGQTPFDAKEMMRGGLDALRQIIREREPLRPSTKLNTLQGDARTTAGKRRQTDVGKLVHQLQGDLDWIVMKCLEKDRTRRYETSSGLAADIQRHLNDESVLASPPSKLYRFQKTVRRNKLAFAAAGAVAAALVIGVVVSTVMFFKEQTALGGEKAARAEVVEKNTELERNNGKFRAMLAEAARSDRLVAEDKLRSGQEQSAFAHLARACEYDLLSPLAAEMAIANLGSWNHELPVRILAGHTKEVFSAQFSPDGTRIVTGSRDRKACVWDVTTGRKLMTLTGHTGWVRSAEFSPDGTRIVTGSYDDTARVWDSTTGETLATLAGHGSSGSAHFSPDGTRIVTMSHGDKTARVWDARSGDALVTLAGRREQGIWVMAQFSRDGTRIVTAGVTNALVWDAVTGKMLATLAGHTRDVRSARFSPNGTRIVTASWDGTARLWDATTGDVLATLAGHEGEVESAQFSPNGTRIVTAGRDDKTVRIWEADTGKLLKTLIGHEGEVHSAQFSSDGDRIVSVSWSQSDSTARVWHVLTGKALVTLSGHRAGVWSAQFSSDGKHIVTASDDNTARIWDPATMQPTPGKPNGLVEFSPDGKSVATASDDKTIRVWEIATGKALAMLAGHTGKVWRVRFSKDGTRIITQTYRGPARLWETATGKALATFAGATEVAEFSPDGTRVVTASDTEPARLWDATTGRILTTFAGDRGEVWHVQFSSDGKRVITRSYEGPERVMDLTTRETLGTLTNRTQGWQSKPGQRIAFVWNGETVRVWDTATGKELATFAKHTGEEWEATVSVDGTQIITTSDKEPARLWDAITGKELQTFAGDKGAAWGTFSPDGTLIVMVSRDQAARVWDTRSGKKLATFTAGHTWMTEFKFSVDGTRIIATTLDTEPPRLWETTTGNTLATLGIPGGASKAEFSPDGRRIITISGRSVAYLLDSATGKVLKNLEGHTGPIVSARFSRDGTRIVTASSDKTARVWDGITGELLATLGRREVDLGNAQFSSDGTRIITTSRDGTVRMWDVLPKDTGPLPEWFPDFLRYMAQMRLNPDGELETLKTADWLALRERLRGVRRASASTDTPYLRILRKYVRET